jgi:hypothetical protein
VWGRSRCHSGPLVASRGQAPAGNPYGRLPAIWILAGKLLTGGVAPALISSSNCLNSSRFNRWRKAMTSASTLLARRQHEDIHDLRAAERAGDDPPCGLRDRQTCGVARRTASPRARFRYCPEGINRLCCSKMECKVGLVFETIRAGVFKAARAESWKHWQVSGEQRRHSLLAIHNHNEAKYTA